MEQRSQHRHGDATGQAQHEGINEDDREGGPEGIEIGELLPGHALQDAERVQQLGKQRVEREIKVVRWIEPRVGEVGDPGLGLDRLVHAVAGDDVDVLQPADQAGQKQERQNERERQLPADTSSHCNELITLPLVSSREAAV